MPYYHFTSAMMKPEIGKIHDSRSIASKTPLRSVIMNSRRKVTRRPPRLLGVAWGFVWIAAGLSACGEQESGGSARAALGEANHRDRFVVVDAPPVIEMTADGDAATARARAGALDPERMAARGDSRVVASDALPFLSLSEQGRAYLAATGLKALARGHPADQCPAIGIASSKGEGDRSAARADVAEKALAACRSDLAARVPDRAAGCGCRLLALGSVITVPREELGYATGVTARLRAPALGMDGLMVAEEEPGGPMVLRGFGGRIATVARASDGTVTVRFEPGGTGGGARIYTGEALPVGFRRGRLAERIYARDEDGNRLVLLIGFSPQELAESAGAWLVWPS